MENFQIHLLVKKNNIPFIINANLPKLSNNVFEIINLFKEIKTNIFQLINNRINMIFFAHLSTCKLINYL